MPKIRKVRDLKQKIKEIPKVKDQKKESLEEELSAAEKEEILKIRTSLDNKSRSSGIRFTPLLTPVLEDSEEFVREERVNREPVRERDSQEGINYRTIQTGVNYATVQASSPQNNYRAEQQSQQTINLEHERTARTTVNPTLSQNEIIPRELRQTDNEFFREARAQREEISQNKDKDERYMYRSHEIEGTSVNQKRRRDLF